MEEDWLISVPFTIDRVSGEYRSVVFNANFRVLNKGDKDTYFRATMKNGMLGWPHILVVREYSDSIKKTVRYDGCIISSGQKWFV